MPVIVSPEVQPVLAYLADADVRCIAGIHPNNKFVFANNSKSNFRCMFKDVSLKVVWGGGGGGVER